MLNLENTIQAIKRKIPNFTPTPPELRHETNAHELKFRLDWGEPGLTILDVRDRSEFKKCHILGAMSLPLEQLQQGTEPSVAQERDIYVYGADDDQTAIAANLLRQAGYYQVAALQGGLVLWSQIGGAMEGRLTEKGYAEADEYNVIDRLREFEQEQEREAELKHELQN